MKNCKTIAKYAAENIIESAREFRADNGSDKYYVKLTTGDEVRTSFNGLCEATQNMYIIDEVIGWNGVTIFYTA